MNVPGPSRVRPSGGRLASSRSERVESTYETDLLGLLSHLTPDDMSEMESFFTRRERAGAPLSDHDIAMADLLRQAHAMTLLEQDRALAQRIAAGEDVGGAEQRPTVHPPRAVPPPGNPIRTAERNGNRPRVQAARVDAVPSETWGGWLSSMVDWVFGTPPTSGATSTNASTPPPRSVANRPTGHDCVICQDPIRGVEIRAPCGHYYDIGCITDLFQSSTRDETLYPPRCCRQNIPFAQVQPHLSQALITVFREKEAEFSTLKRVYCSSPTCSRFLGPVSEGMFATRVFVCPAPECAKRTCGKCRQPHSGDWTHACRPDADVTQVLELSRNAGWARCPGCSQMIELHHGCYHMTCRCHTEFCYLCRARWKTCGCPQWDERRLLAVAEERVDAQLRVAQDRGARHAPEVPVHRVRRPVPAPPPAPARVPVVAPARRLRVPGENVLANRAPGVVPGVTLPVPAPAPVPVTGSARVPPAAVPTPRLLAPPRAPLIEPLHPQPAPARISTVANSMPTPTVMTSTRTLTTTSVPPPAPVASSSTSGQTRWPKIGLRVDPIRQRLVREMMDRLRVDHDCDHGRWRYRDGGGRCQSCGQDLPLYLFRCQGCEMLACNRCRRNRL